MRSLKISLYCELAACAFAGLLTLGACGILSSPHSAVTSKVPRKIEHVVVIFQENRTPDNLFHGLPNADIANEGVNSKGEIIPLAPVSLVGRYDLDHSHRAFIQMFDNGKMDGADRIFVGCGAGVSHCVPRNPQFAYVDPSEVVPYFQLAQQYTFGDRMFQTNQGPSFPAHQFIISGTSAPTENSKLFAAENVVGGAGCTAPPGSFVFMIDPFGVESSIQYPCFEHRTLTDLLNEKHLSWHYYAPSGGSIWTGPNAIRHMRTGVDWYANVVLHSPQVLADIANGQLPAVSWVIPDGRSSDHPLDNNGSGPSWVAAVVNAIGDSQYWSNTAIFLTWDDWGGWYDHVAPPIINSYEYGFRVPLIVVSPYAKAKYISHVMHHFGSILRFIEKNFSLASLGYADAQADDLSDCFDFNQAARPFHTITAQFDAAHFLNDTTPPSDPDDE
jgi:phospholipase C